MRTLITDHRAGRIPRAGKRAGEGERGDCHPKRGWPYASVFTHQRQAANTRHWRRPRDLMLGGRTLCRSYSFQTKAKTFRSMLGIGVRHLNSYAREILSRQNMLNFSGATDVSLALTLTW